MSINSIVTMGFSIDSSQVGSQPLIVSMGYGLTGVLPPPPTPPSGQQPYGPALSPAERERWFGYYGDPDEEKKRKKAFERAKRLELGIIKALPPLKPSIKAEVKAVIEERVFEHIQTPIKLDKQIITAIAKEISLDLKSALKEGRELRELHRQRELKRIEDEEEEEAIEAATLFMLQ